MLLTLLHCESEPKADCQGRSRARNCRFRVDWESQGGIPCSTQPKHRGTLRPIGCNKHRSICESSDTARRRNRYDRILFGRTAAQTKPMAPSRESHIAFPTVVSPPNGDIVCFPLIGLTPAYSRERSIWYLSFEASFDARTHSSGIDPHFTLRGGWDFCLRPWLNLVVEGGVANIGRESIITNADFGQPLLNLGLSCSFKRKREVQE
jgi:hypothetical protein